MKAGLVAALAAVSAVRRAGVPLRGDLLLACVPGEEDGGLGTFATLRRGWTRRRLRGARADRPGPRDRQRRRADLPAAGAGSRDARVAAHRGRQRGREVRAAARRAAAAGGRPQRRRRPADGALADGLPAVDRPGAGRRLGLAACRTCWSPRGGSGVALDEPVEDARAALERAVAEACDGRPVAARAPGRRSSGGAGSSRPAGWPPSSDLADRVAAAHARRHRGRYAGPLGRAVRQRPAAAGRRGGIPTLHYGPGDAVLAHAPDERVPLAEVHTAARALALLALDVCGIA